MKKILYICLVFVVASCTNNFEEINTNPNDPTVVDPSFLLRQVIYNTGEEMSYEGFVAGNLLSQHFTMVDFNLFDRHALTDPQLGGNPWSILYKNLRDVQELIDRSEAGPELAVYNGPAKILKAYLMMLLTDIYGDVPIFDAVKGDEGVIQPAYNAQEDIYLGSNGVKETLLGGIQNCRQQNADNLEGDIFYDGDLSKWVRLGNSLMFKMYMRISDVALDSEAMQSLFDEGEMLMENGDNATFDFTDLQPNSFRMQQLRDGDFNLFVMSETINEILTGLNDPRIGVLFRPIESDTTAMSYRGLLNGPDASSNSITVSNYSLTGTIFRDHTGDLDANFMTAWETQFLIAEAAEKGYINADPELYYNTGVSNAFEYWGVEMPDDYLTGQAAYGNNGANKVEQIITQKWIANSINGYEGWIEYRRTGFPTLKNIAASLNDDVIPVKMPYPSEEEALNNTNYINATSTFGNTINRKVWWDVN